MLARFGGHKCVVGTHKILEATEKFLAVQYDFGQVPDTDLYVMQCPLLPEFQLLQMELQKMGKKVIIELDDDYFNLPDYNPAKKATSPANKKGANRLVTLWCVRHADAVTVTTPALKESIQERTDAPVYVLRNFMNKKLLRDPVYENRTWEKVRVGYLGLSTWHSGDIQEISWMGEWLRDNPNVEFVGQDGPVFDILQVPEEQRVIMEDFSFRHQKLYDHISMMDIGLVPLVRNQFNEAKSHLKGMEYAGAGIPCIATPTESYREWWLSGGDGGVGGAGFLADGPSEWVHALHHLAGDDELRERMGRRARQLAETNSIQNHWRMWENAYNEVIG